MYSLNAATMPLSRSVLLGCICYSSPTLSSRRGRNPQPRADDIAVQPHHSADDAVHLRRTDVIERVAGRCVSEIGELVSAMEGVHRGGETSGFAGKACQ